MFYFKDLILLSLIIAFGCCFIRYVHLRFFTRGSIPDSYPWVGVVGDGFFSRAKATCLSITRTRELLEEGYNKYSKNDIPFVLPNILTGPEVILPPKQMDWLLQQPDNVLDQNEVNRRFLEADYTMLHPKVIRDTVHAEVIRRELGDFTGDLVEELDFAFRKNWGADTKEWKQVVAHDTMSDVITRLSNRVLVGLPLCRNDEYLENSMKFSHKIIITAGIINMMPEVLKPVLAPLVTMYDRMFYWKCAKYIIPIVRQRLNAPVSDEKLKNDYVQWAIDHASADDLVERSPDMISKRLTVLSFAAIHSSAITLTNLLFDLAASPSTPSVLEYTRNEILCELSSCDGMFTKSNLQKMTSLDSCLRESMRLWGFVSRGVLKVVVKKGGIRLPGGMWLGEGQKVGVHAYPIHHDEAIYKGSLNFDGLRWCRSDTEEELSLEDSKALIRGGQKRKGTSLVTTSSTFMAFGHGRHACPGRFFASQQLKLALAYITLNYDIQQISERPANQWLVGSSAPPLDAKIFIRRRAGTE